MTPEQYCNAISNHAKQTTESSLFPGHNYENLASYLGREFEPSRRSAPTAPFLAPPPRDDYPFLHQFSITSSGEKIGSNTHSDPTSWSPTACEKQPLQVVFLSGKPSSKWLSTIGASYKVDPEFFQRHLDFRSNVGRLDYFCLPSLPSAQSTIFQLRYLTLGAIDRPPGPATQEEINALRSSSTQKMEEYWRNVHLGFDRDTGLGDSLVRDCHVYDETHFAIEQQISIALNRLGTGSWQREFKIPHGLRLIDHAQNC